MVFTLGYGIAFYNDELEENITTKGVARLMDYFPLVKQKYEKFFRGEVPLDELFSGYSVSEADFLADCISHALNIPYSIDWTEDDSNTQYLYLHPIMEPWNKTEFQKKVLDISQKELDEAFTYVLQIAFDDENYEADTYLIDLDM